MGWSRYFQWLNSSEISNGYNLLGTNCQSSTYLMGGLRGFLWIKSSPLIDGYTMFGMNSQSDGHVYFYLDI